MSVSFPRLGKFSTIISSNMFSVPPHLFCLCFWGLLYCMCCYAWCCPRDLLNFSHLFLFLFPSFCSGSGFPLLCLSAYWWVSLHCLFCFWLLLCIFQLFYYSSLVGCSLYFPTSCYKLLSSHSVSILLSNSLIMFTIITVNSFSNSLVISTSLNSYGLLSCLEHVSLLTHFA